MVSDAGAANPEEGQSRVEADRSKKGAGLPPFLGAARGAG